MNKFLKSISAAVLLTALSSLIVMVSNFGSALADGGVSRKTTPDEKKMLETLYSELRNALPKAPDGWICNLESERKYDEVGEGFGKMPVMMNAGAAYAKIESESEGEAKSKTAAEIGEKNKASMDAIMKKQDALSAKIAGAAEKMDMKEVERLQKESEVVAAELEKLSAAMTAAMRSSKSGDLLKSNNANANIEVNPSEVYITGPTELPKIDGHTVLREKPENPNYDDKVKTLILIGPWTVTKNSEGGLDIKSPYSYSAPCASIMCAVVHIDADKDMTEALLKTVDLKKLASIISK